MITITEHKTPLSFETYFEVKRRGVDLGELTQSVHGHWEYLTPYECVGLSFEELIFIANFMEKLNDVIR